MRPSGERLVLDTRREMNTIEMGAEIVDIDSENLPRLIDPGAYSRNRGNRLYGLDPMIHRLPFINVEVISITPENQDIAVDSLEAVISLRGIAGAKATVLGRKRMARTILQTINQ